MSTIVTCTCGQSFRAPERLLGKTVACPKCQAPLAIPAAEAPLEELPPADPFASDPLGGGDPFASAAAYSAPLSSPAAAQVPVGEPPPDMRIVWWTILGAGGILVTLVFAMVITSYVNRPRNAPTAGVPTAAPVATPIPAATPTATTAPVSPVTPTPMPTTVAPPPLPATSAGSGDKRSIIHDRFEVTGPVELKLLPQTKPNLLGVYHGALKGFLGRSRAEFVITVVNNPGGILPLEKLEEEVGKRTPWPGATTAISRITVNGRPATLMVSTGGGKRSRSIGQVFAEANCSVLVLVGSDTDYPDADMDRFLQTLKMFK